MNARRFTGIAKYEEIEIPEYSKANLDKLREILLESVAATSDELMEKYFDGGEFTQEEINEALKVNCWDGTLVPCCYDKNGDHTFGNISQQPLDEIWNNGTANDFRLTVLNSKYSMAICRNCPEGRGLM